MWKVAVSTPRLSGPVHGAREDRRVVVVHAEDEGAVDHDAEVVQAADGGVVGRRAGGPAARPGVRRGRPAAGQVLRLAGAAQVHLVERLEADEQAAQPALHRLLEEAGAEDGLDRPGRLPQAAHPFEAVEERLGERRAAEEVVVEEVEVTAGEAVDLGERVVDRLHVERPAAAEERLLVAEVADVRAAAAHDQRVRHQVPLALDEVAAGRRQAGQRPLGRAVQRLGAAGAEVREERRPGVLARPAEHAVGVPGRLLRQARRVQAAEADVGALGAVVVGVAVGATGRGDVRLDDDEVGLVVEAQLLHVLVLQVDLVVRVQVAGQGGEPERGEERVLDRAPVAAVRGRLGRADHLDPERAAQRGPRPAPPTRPPGAVGEVGEQDVQPRLELAGAVPHGEPHADAHHARVVGPVADELGDDVGGLHLVAQHARVAQAERVRAEHVVHRRGAVLAEARLEQRGHQLLHPAAAAGRAHHGRRDERQRARVRLGERVQAHEELAHAPLPVRVRRRHPERRRGDLLRDGVQDGALVGEVVVEAHRLHAGVRGEAAHVHRLEAVLVDDLQGELDDPLAAQGGARWRGLLGDGHGVLLGCRARTDVSLTKYGTSTGRARVNVRA